MLMDAPVNFIGFNVLFIDMFLYFFDALFISVQD